MKKMKLNLESLQVKSFVMTESAETVQGAGVPYTEPPRCLPGNTAYPCWTEPQFCPEYTETC